MAVDAADVTPGEFFMTRTRELRLPGRCYRLSESELRALHDSGVLLKYE